ncbi:MAG: hypothetical protein KDA24_22185, partial [Deltaproteobacteria bacterium]|nr:hypothetical protein [Deltaproteobacteria bacterium]
LGGQELAARLSLPVMRRQLSIAQRVALLADADDRALGSLASLQASAGQLVEARSTCEAMLETDPHRVSAWRLLAHVALRDGDQPAAGHAIQTALDLDPTPDERAAVLMERALLRLDAGDFAAGLEDLTEAQALHTQVKNDDGAARAGLRRALLELAAGQREEGVRSLLRVLPTLDALGLQPLAATARHYLALVALHIGDDEGAAAHLDTAETLWDAAGDSLGLARVAGLRGVLAMLHGDLDEARRQFEEAALAREPAGRPRWSALLLEGRAILAARRGEPVMARQRLAQADALAGGLPVADVQGLQRTKLALESGVDPTPDVSLRGRLLAGLDLNVPPPRYPTLVLGPQARWFEVTGERVDLSRRGAPRRILLALAQAPEGLDIHGVVEAGWPGEALHPEAGRARAYTAVRSLRRFGLQDVLVTGDDGYRLDAVIQRG